MDPFTATPHLNTPRAQHPLEVALPLCVRSLEGAHSQPSALTEPFDRAAVWLAHSNADLSDWCRAGIRKEFRSAARLADAISNLAHERDLLLDLQTRADGPAAAAASIAASRIELELAALRQAAHTLARTPGFLSVFIRDDWSHSDDWFRSATSDATLQAQNVARMAAAALHAGPDGLLAFHAALRVWAAAATIAAEAPLPFEGPSTDLRTAVAAAAVVARLVTTLDRLSAGSSELGRLRARLGHVARHRASQVELILHAESARLSRRPEGVLG